MSPPELALQPFDPADAAAVSAWFPDEPAVVQWGGPGLRWPIDAAQFDRMRADPARSLWTLTRNGQLAGHFQIYTDHRCRTARLGRVAIAPSLRGQGLATPMVRMAADLAFGRDEALHRLELRVYERNAAARAAYERAGFVLEGIMREDVPVTSGGETRFWSNGVMAMLRREWVSVAAGGV